MHHNPKISFVIPIFNSEHLLKDCLESIKKQDYPKNKIEVIIPDGGSADNGAKIVKRYGYKLIKNPKRLAEPGFMLGAKKAKGELIVYMGADNRLATKDWIKIMIKPFSDRKIIAAFPWHRSHNNSIWLTKYVNAFTDPLNHFVMGAASNPLYFHRAYKIRKETKDYVVYDFSMDNFPMLAFDQGFTCRSSYKRSPKTEYDDILPVLDMISKKRDIAFVPKASNYHMTLEKGIKQFSKKVRWIVDVNLFTKSDFGFMTRERKLTLRRRTLFLLWPLYAVSIILPIIHSIVGLIRDRKKEWIYHPQITYLVLLFVLYEIVRVGILKREALLSRQ